MVQQNNDQKAEMIFLKRLDKNIKLSDNEYFTVPGNTLHAKLTYLENKFRFTLEPVITTELNNLSDYVNKNFQNKLEQILFLKDEIKNEIKKVCALCNTFYKELNNDESICAKELKKKICNEVKKAHDNKINAEMLFNLVKQNYDTLINQSNNDYINDLWIINTTNFLEKYKKISENFQNLKNTLNNIIHITNIKTNFVLANIGFVVEFTIKNSNTKNILPKFISIPIKVPSYNMYSNIRSMKDDYSKITNIRSKNGNQTRNFFKNDLLDNNLKKRQPDIESNSFTYCNDYYHSEQALYEYLEEPKNTKKIVKTFKKYIESRKDFSNLAIKTINPNIFLDMHSSRYMCSKCQKPTIYLQNANISENKVLTSNFSKYMAANLRHLFGKEKIQNEVMDVTIRISADINHGLSKKTINDHLENIILEKNNIMAIDSNSFNLSKFEPKNLLDRMKEDLHNYTIFASGGTDKDELNSQLTTYNKLAESVRQEAAKLIQRQYRNYIQEKENRAIIKNLIEEAVKSVIQKNELTSEQREKTDKINYEEEMDSSQNHNINWVNYIDQSQDLSITR